MLEMSTWQDKFDAYYVASNMDILTLKQQHAFFFNSLGTDLNRRLKGLTTGLESVVYLNEILSEIFLGQYPLFQRRLAWFQLLKKRTCWGVSCFSL